MQNSPVKMQNGRVEMQSSRVEMQNSRVDTNHRHEVMWPGRVILLDGRAIGMISWVF